MARGIESFAAGLVTGYTQGKRSQREQELHDLQVAKLKDERAMAEEMKATEGNVKATEGFVITAPDGTRTIFADEAAAKEARAATGGDLQMERKFLVAGQQFDSQEQADDAADAANAPAARMRRQADVARKYGRPDVATSLMQSYKAEVDANRQIAFDNFNQLRQSGDIDGIMKMVNGRRGAKGEASVVQTEDGGVALQTTVNGKPYVGQSFSNMNDLLDGIGNQISATPDNYFERGMSQKNFGLAQDKFTHQKEVDTEQLANAKSGLGLQAQGLALRGQELKLRGDEIAIQRDAKNNPPPDIRYGVNDKGESVPIVQGLSRDASGVWNPSISAQPALTGVRPATARQDPLAGFLTGGAGTSFQFDGSKIPPRTAPAAPSATGPVPPQGGLKTPAQKEAEIMDWYRHRGDDALRAQTGLK